MRSYVRLLQRVLEPATVRSLRRALITSVVLAAIEAVALLAVVPLLQALTAAAAGEPVPSSLADLADAVGATTAAGLAGRLAVAVLVLFLVRSLGALLYLRWYLGVVLEAEASLAARLLASYLGAPLAWHGSRNSAELQRTVQEATRRLAHDGLTGLIGAASDAFVVAGIAVALLVAEPVPALAAAAFFFLVGLGYQRLIHARTAIAAQEVHHEVAGSVLAVQQALGALREIQLGGHQEHFVGLLDASKRRAGRSQRTLLLSYQAPRYFLELALLVGVALLSAALFATRPVPAAVATLGLFLAAGLRVLPSLNRVLVGIGNARSVRPSVLAIAADLEVGSSGSATVADPTERYEAPPHVEVRGVHFAYEAARPLLRDVHLDLPPGAQVALVGPSGGGKSTLVDVVLGLREPDRGAVLLDGAPLPEVRRRWQRSIGFVPQSIALLDGSVRSNVAFGHEQGDVDDDLVREALHAAQLLEVVDALPDGLEARIGEGGALLSGGQRQRIGIARALYGRPAVLVLDEATAAVDAVTEEALTGMLAGLRGTTSLLVVAHRLSTIRRCDRIHLVDQGAVRASGTFEELLAGSERFRRLVELGAVAAP